MNQRINRRVKASLVVMLGVQTFLAGVLAAVGSVGAVKAWLVMLLSSFGTLLI